MTVNPPAHCPVHRNHSGSRGPLSRLLGGHFHNLGTLQRAYANILIYQSKSTPTLESHSFLERVLLHDCHTWPVSTVALGRIVLDDKKREIYIIIPLTGESTDLNAIDTSLRILVRDRGCQDH